MEEPYGRAWPPQAMACEASRPAVARGGLSEIRAFSRRSPRPSPVRARRRRWASGRDAAARGGHGPGARARRYALQTVPGRDGGRLCATGAGARVIGYYAHHHGLGTDRATQIARELSVPAAGLQHARVPAGLAGQRSAAAWTMTSRRTHGQRGAALGTLGYPGMRSGRGCWPTVSRRRGPWSRTLRRGHPAGPGHGRSHGRHGRCAATAPTARTARPTTPPRPSSRRGSCETAEPYWPEVVNRKTTLTGAISRSDVPVRMPPGWGDPLQPATTATGTTPPRR
ncbi:hypothetical protein QJS66_05260 [Kocuria rhizophila]|nr:hypothetical protein QJS66_05260 [Kocuria rhizophila]